jgi:hypothetical protein
VETDLGAPYYRHTVELSGLEPNTEYFYGFVQHDPVLTANEPMSFRTAGSGAFSFLALGDSGSGSAEQQILGGWMKREKPSLVLHLGDLAYPRGSFQDFLAHYFDPCRDLMKRVPFFPCPGNHEYMTRDAFPYLALHDLPRVESVPESDRGRCQLGNPSWQESPAGKPSWSAARTAPSSGKANLPIPCFTCDAAR